jgi:hypothetical protein
MDSTGSNIWTALFKCIFFAYATQQREIARANVSTVEDMCSYGSLITDILRGYHLRYNQASNSDRFLQRVLAAVNMVDPTKQTHRA